MKIGRVFCAFSLALGLAPGLVLVGHNAAGAQSGPSQQRARSSSSSSAFEPLARWKAAVLAGDEAALAALYSTNPPAQAQTPQGTTQDPREEPRFWSVLRPSGLADFQPKVLAYEPKQEGAMEVVLRVEGKLRSSSGEQPFAMAVHQLWVRQGNTWYIAATRRDDPSLNPGRRLPEPAQPKTDLYPAAEKARPEIAAALRRASLDRKRVILVFGANWCYDCHVLDATFHSKEIAPLVDANFHVVHVNIGDEYDKNLDLAARYEVPLKKGVPALAVLAPDGKLLYSQQAGEFENSVRIGPADVVAFLQKWAPALRN